MLLYEVFFFWPLAIIILTHLSAVCNNDKFKMGRLKAPYLFVLVLTYIPYGLLFLLDRVSRLSHGPSIPLSQFFSLKLITLNGLRVFFDVFYNNFLVNLFPWLAWPLRTDENLKMGGFILGHEIALDKIILFAGSLIIVIFIVAIACLFKKKQLETTKTLLFFLFLLFSELFVLFHCKSLVNDTSYILTQFRFQYIPNALCVLTTLFLLDRFLKSLKIKKMIYVVLSLILVLNILAVKGGISILNQQLMPLGKMLSNIKRNIHNGSIGQYNKLYLEDDLSDYLPNLCWNIYMGERFIAQGGYRWLFSSKEIQYFSKDINDAYWIVDKGDFNVIKKSSGSDFKEIAKINAFQDKAYVDVAKDQRYLGVGWFYLEQGDFKAAEAVFKKAIELNPNGYEAYVDLGRCYNSQGNYVQAEEILKKAITLTSKNKHIYLLLEESYKMQRKYK
jgi:tetratricopeptide (TPR) repeat protein